mgnify:CR=1 FL=1
MSDQSSKVINLAERRAQRERQAASVPIPGWLVWLHCPTCETTEYTEQLMLEGRYHKCGTLVEEQEVPIDVRAEYTISLRNLETLDNLLDSQTPSRLLGRFLKTSRNSLKQLRESEEEYQRRLRFIVNADVTPYPEDWTPEAAGMVVEVVQPPGLMLTEARQPQLHFSPPDQTA